MKFLPTINLSSGTKIITYFTSVRWIGWGLVDAMIPIFMFTLVDGFGETGLLKSVYTIVFFIAVPVVGELADHVSLRKLFLIGLSLYFIIGMSYFFAAVFGSIFFIVLARAINGVSYALDNTARETAFLRYEKAAGKAFAFFASTSSFWTFAALIASFFIAPYVDIKWLFLGIVVANFFAYIMARHLPKMKESHNKPFPSIKKMFSRILHLSSLKFFKKTDRVPVIVITILRKLVATLPSSYLAIFTYVASNDIRQAILIAAITKIPAIFSVYVGKYVDRSPRKSLIFGLVLLIVAFTGLSFADTFSLQMVIALLSGIATEIMYLASMVLIKKSTENEHLGNIDSTITSIGSLSEIVGVVILGFMIDALGLMSLGFIISGFLLVGLVFLYYWWYFKKRA